MKLIILLGLIGFIIAETHIELAQKETPQVEANLGKSIPDDLLNLGKKAADEVINKVNHILPKIPPLAPYNEQKPNDLLGGPTDLDNPNRLSDDSSSEEKTNDEESNSDEITSDENADVNSDSNSLILTWFKIRRPDSFDNKMMPYEQEMSPNSEDTIRKCMMHAIMKYKASVVIRSIIHLLFVSGLMLIISFLALIVLKLIKKRKQNSMNMSDDESEGYKYKPLNNDSSSDKEDSKSLPDYEQSVKSEIKS